ncbi:MAG TPA: hypothetical protein DDY52_06180 [Candidatus Moranbacteria bacterium]|nr:hypothetical protein [Candidatus Moranbacteria bacterium]
MRFVRDSIYNEPKKNKKIGQFQNNICPKLSLNNFETQKSRRKNFNSPARTSVIGVTFYY